MTEQIVLGEKRRPGRPRVNPIVEPSVAETPVLEEVKADMQVQPKKDVPLATPSLVTPKYMTPEEMAIYGRVMAQDDDWKTITEESTLDYSLSRDLFEIPAPAKKLEKDKRYKFRWITRDPRRVDEMKNKVRPLKWWVVNRTQPAPGVLDAFIDPVLGCVSREDQMLVFKPWSDWELEKAHKADLADINFRSKDIASRNGEVRKAGRESEVELNAGKRKGTDDRPMRMEITGKDVQFRGESEVDSDMGITHPMASESTLTEE